MSRNNSDRLGAESEKHLQGADAPVSNMNTDAGTRGDPLSFSIPTEHVELPSGGRYYPEDHILHNAETVEIKYMTAKEEDILTSPSLLKKGLTIDRLLRNIVLEKGIDPQNLLSGDRNAIIIAARTTGYGEEYNAKITCPSCYTSTEWNVNLNDLLVTPGGVEAAEGYEVSENDDATFNIQLPKTGVVVTARLFTGKEEKSLTSAIQKRKKHKLEENTLTQQLRTMIVAVNGSTSIADIENFINFVPAFDSRYLRTAYGKLMPNVDMTHDFECNNCSFEGQLEVPLTAEFFWPK